MTTIEHAKRSTNLPFPRDLKCPHCQCEVIVLVEDISCARRVIDLRFDNRLLIEQRYETKGYDLGHNRRFECRRCRQGFSIPESDITFLFVL